jgi:hypothetical protein
MHAFFVQNFDAKKIQSQNTALWFLAPNFLMKNARGKHWWNWLLESISVIALIVKKYLSFHKWLKVAIGKYNYLATFTKVHHRFPTHMGLVSITFLRYGWLLIIKS